MLKILEYKHNLMSALLKLFCYGKKSADMAIASAKLPGIDYFAHDLKTGKTVTAKRRWFLMTYLYFLKQFGKMPAMILHRRIFNNYR
jgi:hypothetical protein